MKAIKTLMAVSILAAAGAANAATVATFSGTTATGILLPMDQNTNTSSVPHVPDYVPTQIVNPGSGGGTASAVLDDNGTFTITAHVHVETSVGTFNDLDLLDTLTGTWSGGTFTPTGGTHVYTHCVDTVVGPISGCASLASGGELPVTVSGSLTLAGGTISATSLDTGHGAATTFTYSFGAGTAPAVPVPAAAWLFGSGLLGLAGTARRRRTV